MRTWPDDFINKIICGDCLEVMKEMPSESIDGCITSPPYWGLRDYGIEQIFGGDVGCEHEWDTMTGLRKATPGDLPSSKSIIASKRTNAENRPGKDSNRCLKCQAWKGQLGLEPTPEMYIEHLTAIFNEVKRVLKKEGTLWLNIGDTYSTHTSKRSGQFGKEIKEGFDDIYSKNRILPLQEKCLCMIPERLAWSLIQNGWILRNKIIWYKPNSMPSSVTDRFSNTWEYLFMFSKSQRYYFDLDAVREPHKEISLKRWGDGGEDTFNTKYAKKHPVTSVGNLRNASNPLSPTGKNPGDVFEINTQPFPEAHFAVFPEKLCEKPIKAGCPEEVCKKCGKARERIIEKYDTGDVQKMPDYWEADLGSHGSIHKKGRIKGEAGIPVMANKTISWTSCDCNAGFEGGILIDPFCGAGMALYVAKEMRRRFIGIDIKQEYCDMCEKRLAQGVL